jgi:hypothetical protein
LIDQDFGNLDQPVDRFAELIDQPTDCCQMTGWFKSAIWLACNNGQPLGYSG